MKSIIALVKHVIITDYHAEFWLSPELSNRDPIISQRALAQVVIVGQGLIRSGITKPLCYNLFFTYSDSLFIRLKHTKMQVEQKTLT